MSSDSKVVPLEKVGSTLQSEYVGKKSKINISHEIMSIKREIKNDYLQTSEGIIYDLFLGVFTYKINID